MTTILALSTNQELWWITLAVGLVVALVVWVLLERLRRSVTAVDEGTAVLWTMGKRLAQNTSTTYLLATTYERGGELLEELGEHAAAAEDSP